MARVGSWGWFEQTQGQLRPRDRLRLFGQGLIMQALELPWWLLGPLGLRPRNLARLDLDRIPVPDTPAAKEAEELCSQMRPAFLVPHSHRTYIWATILGTHRNLSYDAEVLYVSSLLHDLGLSEGHQRPPVPTCFTGIGASAVQQIGNANGFSADKARTAAEAITLHMNLRRRPSEGIEAHLMATGTQLDSIGARYWHIDPRTVEAVLQRHPRSRVKQGFVELFATQAERHPGSRAAFYRYLGSSLLFRFAPFAE